MRRKARRLTDKKKQKIDELRKMGKLPQPPKNFEDWSFCEDLVLTKRLVIVLKAFIIIQLVNKIAKLYIDFYITLDSNFYVLYFSFV